MVGAREAAARRARALELGGRARTTASSSLRANVIVAGHRVAVHSGIGRSAYAGQPSAGFRCASRAHIGFSEMPGSTVRLRPPLVEMSSEITCCPMSEAPTKSIRRPPSRRQKVSASSSPSSGQPDGTHRHRFTRRACSRYSG